MKWIKKGLIFRPDKNLYWMQSHIALPVPVHLNGDRFRIYFSSRDSENHAHIGYAEIDIAKPQILPYLNQDPVLKPGPLGFFDEHGILLASIVDYKDKKYMYYSGWICGKTAPMFYTTIGLAISDDGGVHFKKFSKTPIMDRSEFDPCLVASPFVMIEGNIWRMWYVSGYRWESRNGKLQSYYHIKYAESDNGKNWARTGLVCIDNKDGQETNIARPCIIKENGLYKMWYSFDRGSGYRIGYAESRNGINWIRNDERTGIDVSKSGWDSKMITYPFVFTHKDKKYMLYNGNEFGKDGLGLAVSGE